MRNQHPILLLAGIACLTAIGRDAEAAPVLRHQVDQRGDFVLFGNTVGYECYTDPPVPDPVVGSADCGDLSNGTIVDSSPDLFWRSDSPVVGQAEAHSDIDAEQARSTAMLDLPPGATVTYARIYWAGYLEGGAADTELLVERPRQLIAETLTADDSWTADDDDYDGTFWYQSTADVTSLVADLGSGEFRVSGVATMDLPTANNQHPLGTWVMVVLYELASDPPRNLAVFDGLDFVNTEVQQEATITGFTVPNAGYDAKLGVLTYEGEARWPGDSLQFNATALFDDVNPVDNFFNGSRSWLGAPVSNDGDLPQLTGEPNTMAGMDMDVVDVSSLVAPGDTSATVSALSEADTYLLGAFVTSISTYQPNFETSGKTLTDVNGGTIVPGDVLVYTVTGVNTGNDRAVNTIMTDPLPVGVTYVPGSIVIDSGPNAGAKTDAAGDDQAEYDSATRTVSVRLGTGADATQGGVIEIDESTVVSFEVTVDADAPDTISNQAVISAEGEQGAPESDTPTDGNGTAEGAPPTEGEVGETNDTDGDGLTDDEEGDLGTDPEDADSDDDGVPDGSEPSPGEDTDGDTLINARDPDSDNDGLFDGTEMGLDCSNEATDLTAEACVADGDEGATTTDPLDPDTDDGTVNDGAEDADHDGVIDDGETDPTEGHGDDDVITDSDGDGLSDDEEEALGSDPEDADSDDDGVPDGEEPNPSHDTDGDGDINILDPDSDGDGLFDGTEMGRDCPDPPTDLDAAACIPDGDEGDTTTSPLDPDTDDGGVPDGEEDTDHDGVIDQGERDPNDPADDDASEGTAGAGGVAGAGGAEGGAPAGGAAGSGAQPAATGGTEAPAATGGTGTGATGATGATSSGDAGAGEAYPEGVLEGGGCDCSLPGRGSRPLSALLAFGAALLLGRRSRRR